MRRILPLLLALSAALLGSCSLTLFDYSNIVSKHYALVYGVTIYDTNYTAGVYPNLNYPGSDASAVAAMLTAEGYTVKSRWITLSQKSAQVDPWKERTEGPKTREFIPIRVVA